MWNWIELLGAGQAMDPGITTQNYPSFWPSHPLHLPSSGIWMWLSNQSNQSQIVYIYIYAFYWGYCEDKQKAESWLPTEKNQPEWSSLEGKREERWERILLVNIANGAGMFKCIGPKLYLILSKTLWEHNWEYLHFWGKKTESFTERFDN